PGLSVTFGYAEGGGRLWRCGTNCYTVWIGGIYELKDGKTLCHVFAGGKRLATFEPQGGGPWAKIFGEERWFAASIGIQRILDWPFQKGRAPLTLLLLTFSGMAAVCLAGRRATSASRRRGRRLHPLLRERAGVRACLRSYHTSFFYHAVTLLT